jgi:hypothetical protein
MDVRGT